MISSDADYNYYIKSGLLVIKKENSIVLVDDC
jgi:hypothetical protein